MRFELKNLHLIEPFRIAHGTSSTRQVLRVSEGQHVAEAPFVPYYGEDPQQTLALLRSDTPPANLPRTAQLALNLLQHDIQCHATGTPLSVVAQARLGPSSHPAPPGCRGLGITENLATHADKVRALARQFSVIKLKLGSGDLAHDLALVANARQAAPHAQILLDANGGWSIEDTPAMLVKLAPHRPALVEQPFHHQHGVEGWKTLRARIPDRTLPLFADESAQNADDVAALAPYVDGVNIKLLKCAGLDGAIAMFAAARQHRLQPLLGCMVETSLGTTAAAHLAPWADWIDLDGHLFITNDDHNGIQYSDTGQLRLPARPGIGALPISLLS